MRKPTPAATRTIVLAALALLLVASCSDSKDTERVVAQSGPGHLMDSAAMPSVGGDARRGYAARVMSVPVAQPPALAKSERALPRSDASSNASEADPISLGTPMPAVDPAGAMIVRHG